MKKIAVVCSAAMLLAAPQAASAQNAEELSAPTPLEFADVREITDEIMDGLIKGETEKTLRGAVESSPLFAQKTNEITNLINQFDNVTELYGEMEQCVPWEQSYTSSLRITTTYVCQLRDFLIFWELRADKLPTGWAITNLRFNDTF